MPPTAPGGRGGVIDAEMSRLDGHETVETHQARTGQDQQHRANLYILYSIPLYQLARAHAREQGDRQRNGSGTERTSATATPE